MLEAQLFIERLLHQSQTELYDKWERALYRYARGETDKSYAREALGTGEYWDAGIIWGEKAPRKWFLPIRRVWRRFKEWYNNK